MTRARERAGPTTRYSRHLDDLNWMEFREIVPAKCSTVILTTGTLEPHGVTGNGTDNVLPVRLAEEIAPAIGALIAPHIAYGVTGRLANYPGAVHIDEAAYRPYLRSVMKNLVSMGFRTVAILNGHGGPQTAILESICQELMVETRARFVVVNWWSTCADVTKEVFGEDGGHAGVNETALVQAYAPHLVHRDRIRQTTATAFPAPGTWAAFPFPSSIGLYKEGEGMPRDFDPKKADLYRKKVVAKLTALLKDVVAKWDAAGL